jgi:hypothetical protein
MARSLLAIVAGYLTMLVIVTGSLGFLFLVFHDAFPREPGPYNGPAFVLVLELAFAAIAAIAGGWICALLARRKPLHHAAVLVVAMTVLGLVSASVEAGLKPMWSTIALPIVGAIGVLFGAWLRARQGR